MLFVRLTPVALFFGMVLITVGGVVSAGLAVVNVQLVGPRGLSARSRIAVAPPVSVAVYVVPSARGELGCSLATVGLSLVTVAETAVVPFVSVKLVSLTPCTGSLKV